MAYLPEEGQKQKENDISSLIEALIYKTIDEVCKEYVEAEKVSEARVYWRSLFFEAIIGAIIPPSLCPISPILLLFISFLV